MDDSLKRGDYYFVVKGNQKSLLEDVEAVRLDREPPSYERAGKRAGRVETRAIWTSQTLSGYTDWPHMAQVCRIERIVVRGPETSADISYAVTSLSPRKASGRRLLKLSREHWGIENRLQWVRDVTFDEDRCQARAGSAPQVLSTIRNTVIGLLRIAGNSNIAAALRRNAAHPDIPLRLVGG